MTITEVRVKLGDEHDVSRRCLAYVSVTFDKCFVVHDIKVVRTESGTLVSMPARRICATCLGCGRKRRPVGNPCVGCGNVVLRRNHRGVPGDRWADVAHPITKEFRGILHAEIIRAYHHAVRLTTPSDERALVAQ